MEHSLSSWQRQGSKGIKTFLLELRRCLERNKRTQDFVNKNDFSFSELLISCKCNLCFRLVNTSRSGELPEEDACLDWKILVSKFAPTTKFNLVKTKKEFVESKFEEISRDPDQ
jgi:hypothetical protein